MLATALTQKREAPQNRRPYSVNGLEEHLPEAAVMVAFAMYLLREGAPVVELHPDGEHGKRFDIRSSLESRGFVFTGDGGTTTYSGEYRRGAERLSVSCKPGIGDVSGVCHERPIVGECKGGILNTRHPGQASRLRKGLCEAVGLLMSRPLNGERHMAVVPATEFTKRLARRMTSRAMAAGIEIALVDANGNVDFVR
jgi:hypothetical protein